MMLPRSVVVASMTSDRLNTNWQLREYVAEGFELLLGAGTTVTATAERTIEAIGRHKPDLVVAFGSVMPDSVDLRTLRREVNALGGHLAVWLHDDPYELDFSFRVAGAADTIFTNDLGSVPFYRPAIAHHLPLAASAERHFVKRGNRGIIDLFFCGVGFDNRIRFLREIEDELRAFRTEIIGAGWPENWWLAENRRVTNEELTVLYGLAATALNVGRDFDLANERYIQAPSTPGPRTFEAAMAGCLQFYHATSLEILDYFKPDEEIIVIDDPCEIPQRLAALLHDPQLLVRMQEASQRRALADHTYRHRAERIIELCQR